MSFCNWCLGTGQYNRHTSECKLCEILLLFIFKSLLILFHNVRVKQCAAVTGCMESHGLSQFTTSISTWLFLRMPMSGHDHKYIHRKFYSYILCLLLFLKIAGATVSGCKTQSETHPKMFLLYESIVCIKL